MNEIFALIQEYIVAYTLSSIRLSVAFSVLPLFSQAVIPGMPRKMALASLALVIVPHIKAQIPAIESDMLTLVPIFLKEAFIGMLIGYIAAILFWIAEAIGFLIDNQRGSSMASAFDPMLGGESSPLGMVVSKAVITLFFVFGGFLSILSVVYESYLLWPVFSFSPHLGVDFPVLMLKLFDDLTKMAILYASPIMLLLFFSEFGLGLMNRFAQQLNVFVLAMPVKSGLAMFLFVIYMSYLLDYFKVEFLRIPNIIKMLEVLIT